MFKLLIATDGSAHADHAIKAAAKLARLVPQSKVLMLNVREFPVIYGDLPLYDAEAIETASKAGQDQLLRAAQAHAQACGLAQVELLRAQGLPATEIARIAAEQSVDQIVMGTHGRNALAGLVMGSVAQRVVHLVNLPVLLVK